MILTLIGCFILGNITNQYGSYYIYNYFYPQQSNISTNINDKELCLKCNKFTDKSIPHCTNCRECHHEFSKKTCNECKQCIYYENYNTHTKKECCSQFVGQDD